MKRKDSDLPLRLASRGDLPAIVAIYNSIVAGRMVTADLDPVSVAEREDWFAGHVPPGRPLWVLEEAGEILAWMGFQDFHHRAAYAATAEIALYLREDQRGRGLGTRLLAEGLARAPGCGIRTVMALIFAHNLPSLGLFERSGFTRWGHYPGIAVLDGVQRDLCVLGRRLEE